MAFNSDRFDLANWKLTLPVDARNGIQGIAAEIKKLVGYENSHFYDAADGAMVFKADVRGATTSGSKYARTELREMNGSDRAAWTLSEGGTMTATLKVDAVPVRSDGSDGRVVVGQIHGQDDELVRLYWQGGSVHFVNDQAGARNAETVFTFKNAAGQAPKIDLGEVFSYKIDAHGDTLTVKVYADGDVYTSVSKINNVWQSDKFYFKAGVYLGVNETQGYGSGQTSFYGLDFSHKKGGGDGGLVTAPGRPDPVGGEPPYQGGETPVVVLPTKPPIQPSEPKPDLPAAGTTVAGTGRDDTLFGRAGDDTLYGRGGDDHLFGGSGGDILWGNAGNDRLEGGAGDDWMKGGDGRDVFVFAEGHGHDVVHEFRRGETIELSHAMFGSAAEAQSALRQTSDGVVLQTGVDSSILFTGTTMDLVKAANWLFDH